MKVSTEAGNALPEVEDAVKALEKIKLGAVEFTTANALAAQKRDALEAAAIETNFPLFVPVTADAVATIEHNADGDRRQFPAKMLAVHHAAMAAGHPAATVIRSAAMLYRVGASLSIAQADMATETQRVREFARDIAQQMLDAGRTDPAAHVLAIDIPALSARIVAVEQRHEKYAEEQARLAEVEAQRQKAARREARIAGESDLRDRFRKFSNASFNYSPHNADWSTVATILRGDEYERRVLKAEGSTGMVPDWRVRQAIAAIRTVEPSYSADWFIEGELETEPAA